MRPGLRWDRARPNTPAALAERCPEQFRDFHPYVGSGGLDRYTKELVSWINHETGTTTGRQLHCDVMRELGVDLAEWFRSWIRRTPGATN